VTGDQSSRGPFDAIDNPLWGSDWPGVRALWSLDPERTHLNHGSFGAVPIQVQSTQDAIRREVERNPTAFFWRALADRLEEARLAAASFLRADPGGFAFVPNATTAVSTILGAVALRPGDEVLVSDHTYGAVRFAAQRACRRAGATLVVQPVPLPVEGPETLASAFLLGVTERTRLAIVDHIASPTALLFPAKRLVDELHARDVLVLVDGAHAPGALDVDLGDLGPDFWTGNFHKWCCAPRGTAGLFVAPEHRDQTEPLTASWPYPLGFPASFSFIGTDDYSAYLALPSALSFMASLGWDRVRKHNRGLARVAAQTLADALATDRAECGPDDVFEAMRLVPLPPGVAATEEDARSLYLRIADELRIEAAVVPWNGRGFLRLSAQAYNAPAEYERLAAGLKSLLNPTA
jgi:isopenicillin-N epimerase